MSLLADSTKGKIIWQNPNKNKPVNCPSCGRFMKFEKMYEDVFLDHEYYWSQWKTYACQCGAYETVEIICWEYVDTDQTKKVVE